MPYHSTSTLLSHFLQANILIVFAIVSVKLIDSGFPRLSHEIRLFAANRARLPLNARTAVVTASAILHVQLSGCHSPVRKLPFDSGDHFCPHLYCRRRFDRLIVEADTFEILVIM